MIAGTSPTSGGRSATWPSVRWTGRGGSSPRKSADGALLVRFPLERRIITLGPERDHMAVPGRPPQRLKPSSPPLSAGTRAGASRHGLRRGASHARRSIAFQTHRAAPPPPLAREDEAGLLRDPARGSVLAVGDADESSRGRLQGIRRFRRRLVSARAPATIKSCSSRKPTEIVTQLRQSVTLCVSPRTDYAFKRLVYSADPSDCTGRRKPRPGALCALAAATSRRRDGESLGYRQVTRAPKSLL